MLFDPDIYGLPRLYVPNFRLTEPTELEAHQGHYLSHVLRRGMGDNVRIFSPHVGEYLAEIVHAKKTVVKLQIVRCLLSLDALAASHATHSYPTLYISPPKQEAWHELIRLAVELGVRCIAPVITARCVNRSPSPLKVMRWCIEAVEQSEHCHLPELREPCSLELALTQHQPHDGPIFWAAERSPTALPLSQIKLSPQAPGGFLIGPEGGFTQQECTLLQAGHGIQPVTLGASILRSPTATAMLLSWARCQRLTA